MPYSKFTKIVKGKKKYCTRNLETGEVVEYDSAEKRASGIQMREAIHHGFKPTGKKGKGRIKKH
ncbi:MAG: hypothetical protein ACFFDN_10805 [Candidatus Hodarchaeota archaeon]